MLTKCLPTLTGYLSNAPAIEPPVYQGEDCPYTVSSLADQDQVLPTKNKLLTDNITVEKIRYQEVSNPSGGVTTYIGR